MATVGTASGPLLYAFTLGLVAAVNPCGFPLLGAYLSFFVGDGELDRTRRNLRGVGAGASVTAGFVVVFALLGVLVHSGVDVALGWVPWVMVPIALAMAAIGVVGLAGRPLRLVRPLPRLGSGRGVLAMAGFGIAYAVASLTCALPLFLAAVASSFGRIGVLDGVGAFAAYALGMGLFLMVAGLVVANAGVAPLRRMRAITRVVPRVAGGVLAVVGAYLTFYWISYLVDPVASPEPIGVVEHLQTLLTGWLSESPRVIGIVLAAMVGIAVAATLLVRSARPERAGTAATPATATEPRSVGVRG